MGLATGFDISIRTLACIEIAFRSDCCHCSSLTAWYGYSLEMALPCEDCEIQRRCFALQVHNSQLHASRDCVKLKTGTHTLLLVTYLVLLFLLLVLCLLVFLLFLGCGRFFCNCWWLFFFLFLLFLGGGRFFCDCRWLLIFLFLLLNFFIGSCGLLGHRHRLIFFFFFLFYFPRILFLDGRCRSFRNALRHDWLFHFLLSCRNGLFIRWRHGACWFLAHLLHIHFDVRSGEMLQVVVFVADAVQARLGQFALFNGFHLA
mmetsp:Transcript_160612/g.296042  ORF Transcript_160612/g.296042 Transcript_160612/m.296042 type:complete len:259 (+) Transcript_160612:486-1262(+)